MVIHPHTPRLETWGPFARDEALSSSHYRAAIVPIDQLEWLDSSLLTPREGRAEEFVVAVLLS